jgi:hypothetical protein
MMKLLASALALAALCLTAPQSAAAQTVAGHEFADWTAVAGNVATGTLRGSSVRLAGTLVRPAPSSTLDGTSTIFARDVFTPPLPASDALEFGGFTPNYSYTLTFGVPQDDPILHLQSLGSALELTDGTTVTKVSGDSALQASGHTVTATSGQPDVDGTVRLNGTLTSVSFTATPVEAAIQPDGIGLQVGVKLPPAPDAPIAPPAPSPPPPPPPPSPAPAITGVDTATFAGGTVLSADVSGPVAEIAWDVTGDGRSDTSCPGDQTSLVFRASTRRARAAQAVRITTRVTSPGGIVAQITTSAAPPPPAPPSRSALPAPLVQAASRSSYRCVDGGAVAKTPAEIAGIITKGTERRCLRSTVQTGPLWISGCMTPITRMTQIRAAEREAFADLLRTEYGVEPGSHDVAAGALDGMAATGPVTINGVEVAPAPGSSVIVLSQLRSVLTADAALSAGGIRLEHRRGFLLDTRWTGGHLSLGSFRRLPGGTEALAFFGIDGDVDIDLTGTSATDAHALVRTHLKLPPYLGSFAVSTAIRLEASGRFDLDALSIGPMSFGAGPFGVRDLKIDYENGLWRGQLGLCFGEGQCIDARPVPGEFPQGGVEIGPNGFRVYASLPFPAPGLQVGPGVFLTRIGAGLADPPLRITGGAQLRALGLVEMNGALTLAFPSTSAPYRLVRSEMGNSFPVPAYQREFRRFTVAAGADIDLRIPGLDLRTRLGGGHFLYEAPGLVSLGGGIEADFLGVIKLRGGMSGDFNLDRGRFNLHGDVKACIADIPVLGDACVGSVGHVSTIGAGGCVQVGPLSVGAGLRFAGPEFFLWPFDGCRWSVYRDDAVFARAAQATGGARTVTVKAGEPSRAIDLRGRDGAPRVRVTGPGGVDLTSSAGPGLTTLPKARIMRSESLGVTVVGLVDPAPGTFTITPLDGSPAITRVRQAVDQPVARARASVTGRGARRTLAYDLVRRADQRVTFLEQTAQGTREIGRATGGRGRLTFSPAPGKGRTAIVAQFELAGVPAERLTVARFSPPAERLGRVASVSVRRSGGRVLARWSAVPEATRYEVVVRRASGGERRLRVTRRAIAVTVPRWSGGTVRVRALDPLREGPVTTARFARTGARPQTRVRPLPR